MLAYPWGLILILIRVSVTYLVTSSGIAPDRCEAKRQRGDYGRFTPT